MVEEEGVVGAAHGLVQVSVWADDAGALAAQLQRDRDHILGRVPHNDLAHLRAARERNLHANQQLDLEIKPA